MLDDRRSRCAARKVVSVGWPHLERKVECVGTMVLPEKQPPANTPGAFALSGCSIRARGIRRGATLRRV